ncbi:TetR/AcrR family transcriptional regulator [Thermosediminibacter litoriperuensis]|uniref:TetR family transcriptional regulator n=1 Tax=Thermosediminibacter litoriperuensis TaxID=291989 RepID=A0A5S5AMB9_9FIRM|nr:TetR/AcrR family transcriptional regulator [Thermosediminibacter litoriperuensis]TYP52504.1 TetR family transcriptional regulator [Thermosediminibacter litoriperuensis]
MGKEDIGTDRKRERYESIIKAAGELFTRKGFHDTKMEEIAELAGIGKGTVYEYFRSKKDLFFDVIKYCTSNFLDDFKSAAAKGKDYRERLDNALSVLIRYFQESSNFFKLLIKDHREIDEKLYEWLVNVKIITAKIVQDILEEGMKAGELKPVMPVIPALMLLESCRLVLFRELFKEDEYDPESIKVMVIDIVLNGIRVNGSRT